MAQNIIDLELISTYHTGVFDGSAAEIVVHDPNSNKVFFTNSNDNEIGVLDISNLDNITKTEINLPVGGVNSVAHYGGYLAVAMEDTVKQANGKVLLYTVSGDLVASLTVGALPDMVIFSPDGNKVLSANEGEPNADYTVDPYGTVSIIDISGGISNVSQSDVKTLDFSHFNNSIDPLVRINGNSGTATVAEDLEPEFIAVSDDNEWAYVSLQENNAFGIIDLINDSIVDVMPLGYKDWGAPGNVLDASDKRSDVFFSGYTNLYGMYMPDAIKFYSVNGASYLISANEGDGREYDNFEDEEKVGNLLLDSVAFPDFASLQEDSILGRLKVSTTDGDIDNDGYFEKLYAFGARSFSIWNMDDQNLVYDSGSEIEQKVYAELPDNFNATNDDNSSLKNRSDNKGPEPEAIAIGEVDGYQIAFVGLERVGGIMSFDITDPEAVNLLGYTNNRNFTVPADSSAAGDLGPEDIVFVSASENTTGKPLLIVSNEVSGTVSFFEVKGNFIGLDELSVENQVTFEPNPTQNFLQASAKDVYNVYDMMGTLLFTTDYTDIINLESFDNGIYLVRNGKGQASKVVKH